MTLQEIDANWLLECVRTSELTLCRGSFGCPELRCADLATIAAASVCGAKAALAAIEPELQYPALMARLALASGIPRAALSAIERGFELWEQLAEPGLPAERAELERIRRAARVVRRRLRPPSVDELLERADRERNFSR